MAEHAAVMIDATGTVVSWSDEAADWFGHTPHDVLGQLVEVIVPADLRDGHRAGLARAMSGGERHLEGAATHLPVLHADGTTAVHPARFNHVFDASGALVGAVATFGPACDAEPWTPIAV